MSSGDFGPPGRGAVFHDSMARGWSDRYERGSFRRRLEFIVPRLSRLVKPGARWLDLGCGSGRLTDLLAELGAVGEAVDGSKAMIDAARRAHFDHPLRDFTFRWVRTVEKLDIEDSSCDGVLCSSVIEYLEHPDVALDEIQRVLKPRGVLFISLSNSLSPLRLAQQAVRTAGKCLGKNVFPHLAVSKVTYTKRRIRRTLRSRGFCVVGIDGFYPLSIVSRIKLAPPALLFATATKVGRTAMNKGGECQTDG